MSPEEERPDKARLHWQCRRGMRELDLLLEDFMAHRYDELAAHEQAAFGRLLSCPDHLLLEYLMGRLTPSDREIAHVVAEIRGAPAH